MDIGAKTMIGIGIFSWRGVKYCGVHYNKLISFFFLSFSRSYSQFHGGNNIIIVDDNNNARNRLLEAVLLLPSIIAYQPFVCN